MTSLHKHNISKLISNLVYEEVSHCCRGEKSKESQIFLVDKIQEQQELIISEENLINKILNDITRIKMNHLRKNSFCYSNKLKLSTKKISVVKQLILNEFPEYSVSSNQPSADTEVGKSLNKYSERDNYINNNIFTLDYVDFSELSDFDDKFDFLECIKSICKIMHSKDEDWREKFNCFILLRRIIKFHPTLAVFILRRVIDEVYAILDQHKNSAILKICLITLLDLFSYSDQSKYITTNKFIIKIINVIPKIFSKIFSENAYISNLAFECIKSIVNNCAAAFDVSLSILRLIKHKNMNFSLKALEIYYEWLTNVDNLTNCFSNNLENCTIYLSEIFSLFEIKKENYLKSSLKLYIHFINNISFQSLELLIKGNLKNSRDLFIIDSINQYYEFTEKKLSRNNLRKSL